MKLVPARVMRARLRRRRRVCFRGSPRVLAPRCRCLPVAPLAFVAEARRFGYESGGYFADDAFGEPDDADERQREDA